MDNSFPFSDPAMVARYAEDTPRKVPGYADLHRMAMLLLFERLGSAADILVLGAGGGLELKALAEAQANWRFTGIDPSSEMLDLARTVLGTLESRVDLKEGYIDAAPPGPYDAALCLLTLHFLGVEERLHILRALHARLKPGAPLVVAHHSCPSGGDARSWLRRSVAFAAAGQPDFPAAAALAEFMSERLHVLSSDEDEALLREGGFSDVSLFYAGFSFRGWIATA
ncbi:MAG: methyltransferase [Erythrobacter sp.]|nr:methyltransferase [Erythrobacter sp.]|tara:strand:- start:164 stop:841 length:678 start_codon:yes stop_codon:yes gene_type:complete